MNNKYDDEQLPKAQYGGLTTIKGTIFDKHEDEEETDTGPGPDEEEEEEEE